MKVLQEDLRLLLCDVCGKVFDSESSMQEHMTFHEATHNGMSSPETDLCEKTFSSGTEEPQYTGTSDSRLLLCEICGEVFFSESEMEEHLTSHENHLQENAVTSDAEDVPYTCDVCGKHFTKSENYKSHVMACRKKLHNCQFCGQTFRYRSVLARHIRCHTKKALDPFLCFICGKKFSRTSYLEAHYDLHRSACIEEDYRYGCTVCGKIFLNRIGYLFHFRGHTQNKQYRCDTGSCDHWFATVKDLKRHQLQIHSQVTPYNYRCDICSKEFFGLFHLKQHRLSHTVEKPYNCKLCNKAFALQDSLKQHLKLHKKDLPYRCDFCKKGFRYSHDLNRHKCRYSEKYPYVCDICKAGFNKYSFLSRHNRYEHPEVEKVYTCDICRQVFSRNSTLKDHKVKAHKVVFPKKTGIYSTSLQVKCEVCGSTFSKLRKLKKHELAEHGEIMTFNYKCEVCKKEFPFIGHLKKHLLSHTDVKTFKCVACPKVFRYPDTLKRHLRFHTAEMPFQCEKCSKRFQRSDHLRVHKFSCYHSCKEPRTSTKSDASDEELDAINNGNSDNEQASDIQSEKSVESDAINNGNSDNEQASDIQSEKSVETDAINDWNTDNEQASDIQSEKSVQESDTINNGISDDELAPNMQSEKSDKDSDIVQGDKSNVSRNTNRRCSGRISNRGLSTKEESSINLHAKEINCSNTGTHQEIFITCKYNCTKCLRGFPLLARLKRHACPYGDVDNPYKCPICKKGYKHLRSLKRHLRSHNLAS